MFATTASAGRAEAPSVTAYYPPIAVCAAPSASTSSPSLSPAACATAGGSREQHATFVTDTTASALTICRQVATASPDGVHFAGQVPYLKQCCASPPRIIFQAPTIVQLRDAGVFPAALAESYSQLPNISLSVEEGRYAANFTDINRTMDEEECLGKLNPPAPLDWDVVAYEMRGREPTPSEAHWEEEFYKAVGSSREQEKDAVAARHRQRRSAKRKKALSRASMSSRGGSRAAPLAESNPESAASTPFSRVHSLNSNAGGTPPRDGEEAHLFIPHGTGATDGSDASVDRPAAHKTTSAQRTAKGFLRRAKFNEIRRVTPTHTSPSATLRASNVPVTRPGAANSPSLMVLPAGTGAGPYAGDGFRFPVLSLRSETSNWQDVSSTLGSSSNLASAMADASTPVTSRTPEGRTPRVAGRTNSGRTYDSNGKPITMSPSFMAVALAAGSPASTSYDDRVAAERVAAWCAGTPPSGEWPSPLALRGGGSTSERDGAPPPELQPPPQADDTAAEADEPAATLSPLQPPMLRGVGKGTRTASPASTKAASARQTTASTVTGVDEPSVQRPAGLSVPLHQPPLHKAQRTYVAKASSTAPLANGEQSSNFRRDASSTLSAGSQRSATRSTATTVVTAHEPMPSDSARQHHQQQQQQQQALSRPAGADSVTPPQKQKRQRDESSPPTMPTAASHAAHGAPTSARQRKVDDGEAKAHRGVALKQPPPQFTLHGASPGTSAQSTATEPGEAPGAARATAPAAAAPLSHSTARTVAAVHRAEDKDSPARPSSADDSSLNSISGVTAAENSTRGSARSNAAGCTGTQHCTPPAATTGIVRQRDPITPNRSPRKALTEPLVLLEHDVSARSAPRGSKESDYSRRSGSPKGRVLVRRQPTGKTAEETAVPVESGGSASTHAAAGADCTPILAGGTAARQKNTHRARVAAPSAAAPSEPAARPGSTATAEAARRRTSDLSPSAAPESVTSAVPARSPPAHTASAPAASASNTPSKKMEPAAKSPDGAKDVSTTAAHKSSDAASAPRAAEAAATATTAAAAAPHSRTSVKGEAIHEPHSSPVTAPPPASSAAASPPRANAGHPDVAAPTAAPAHATAAAAAATVDKTPPGAPATRDNGRRKSKGQSRAPAKTTKKSGRSCCTAM